MARKTSEALTWAPGAQMTVPVLGVAGGCGRSTVAALTALGLSAWAPTVVLDTVPNLSSPWRHCSPGAGSGLAAIPPDRGLRTSDVIAAASPALGGAVQVLSDHRPWSQRPLALPPEPASWVQLARIGGWPIAVADSAHLVGDDLVAAHWGAGTSLSARWCALPGAVGLLCAAANREQLEAAAVALAAAESQALALQRVVLVVVATADGLPRQVRAVVTMLAPRLAAVVTVPYDVRWRSHGLRDADQMSRRQKAAAAELAATVLEVAERSAPAPLRLPCPPVVSPRKDTNAYPPAGAVTDG